MESRSILNRAASAVGRRCRRQWSRWIDGAPPPAAPRACDWLVQRLSNENKLIELSTRALSGLLPTLLEFGQDTAALAIARQLLERVPPRDGFSTKRRDSAGLLDTAAVVDGLLDLMEILDSPVNESRASRLASDELRSSSYEAIFDGAGRLADRLSDAISRLSADERNSPASDPPVAEMFTLTPAMLRAGDLLGHAEWIELARKFADRAQKAWDLGHWRTNGRRHAQVVESMLRLNLAEMARTATRLVAASDRKGRLPSGWGDPKVDASLSAIHARNWFELSRSETHASREVRDRSLDYERGSRVLEWLKRHQRPDGAISIAARSDSNCANFAQDMVATSEFLRASAAQVRAAFEVDTGNLPDEIGLHDGRLDALRETLGRLTPGSLVADVGCGSGRFSKVLGREFPRLRFVGIDPSPALLEHSTASFAKRQGGLRRIPARDGEFDAVFCVEALEHCLVPERGVQELARVTRSGGAIAIIDKSANRQSLSIHEPWEEWFAPEQISGWLSPWCDSVRCQRIAHEAERRPGGLFLCWTARRRNEQVMSRAA